MNKTKKTYLTPSMKVVNVEAQQILAGSDRTFSAPRNIKKGNDSDWGEDLDW